MTVTDPYLTTTYTWTPTNIFHITLVLVAGADTYSAEIYYTGEAHWPTSKTRIPRTITATPSTGTAIQLDTPTMNVI
jgi:hypothetical protein